MIDYCVLIQSSIKFVPRVPSKIKRLEITILIKANKLSEIFTKCILVETCYWIPGMGIRNKEHCCYQTLLLSQAVGGSIIALLSHTVHLLPSTAMRLCFWYSGHICFRNPPNITWRPEMSSSVRILKSKFIRTKIKVKYILCICKVGSLSVCGR